MRMQDRASKGAWRRGFARLLLVCAIALAHAGAAGAGDADRQAGVERARVDGADIRIEYADGWSEEIRDGRYELRDDAGRRVIRRPATEADRARMLDVLK